MIKKRAVLATFVAGAVLLISQPTFGALPPVSTSPTFSLDFSDSSKVSGTTWTDQIAGLSATAVNTQFSTELGGVETFTGTSSYLDFGKPLIGSALNPTSDISGEVWVRINTFNANWNIFLTHWFDDTGGNGTTHDFHFSVYSDGISPRQLNLYTTGKYDLRGTSTIVTGKWYHFAFTVDNTSATKRIALYVNGKLETEYTQGSSVRTANTNNAVWVGDARSVVAPNGQIAKVRLYNRALTATEIKSNFDADRSIYGFATKVTLAATNSNYRTAQILNVTSTSSGTVTFYANDKVIPGCVRKSISASSACAWKPSLQGFNTVKAIVTPSDNQYANGIDQSRVFISKRTNNR
jgi:hypothetical protein